MAPVVKKFFRWGIIALLLLLPVPASSQGELPCDSAEECFAAAILPDPGGNGTADSRIGRLKLVQQQHPGSVWAKRAGLLIGLLSVERDPADAVRFLRMAQRDFPVLEDYLRLWKGEALLRLGDLTQAAGLFESIPEAVPDTSLEARAAFRAGETWYRAGDCPKATGWLTEAVTRAAQDPAAAEALLMVADCQGRDTPSKAASTLRRLWVRYPQTPVAREAMERLVQALGPEAARPSGDELYERAGTFLNLTLYQEAAGAFRDFLAAAPQHPNRDDAQLKLGIALTRLKRYDEAQSVFQQLAGQSSAEALEAVLWLARVHLRQDQGDRLLALRQSPAVRAFSADQKAALLLLVGTWYSDHDQLDAALAAFKEAAGLQVAAGQRVEAWWRIGWIQYRRGQFQEAAGTFQAALGIKDRPATDTPQLLYWTARAMERLADPTVAERYEDLCRRFPLTFYCLLAQSRRGLTAPGGSLDGPGGENAIRQDLRRDAHYRRAVELKLLGLDQDAGRELLSFTARSSRDRSAALELSILLSEAGAFHQALRVARLHYGEMLEQSGEPVPAALWNIAYPTGYLSRIRVHAGTRVDPYLVAAIIREESQYDPRAVSRSGALGLMQLLPATAQTMARQQGLRDLSREELFDHEINIRFGTRYLAQMVERFDGNLVYAVAAYNAGPAAVAGWIAKNGNKDVDEFVESIPFQETRQYVKRVIRSYREYRRIARLACAASSLDKVC
jgi:soluble lytic murein transglycosylase